MIRAVLTALVLPVPLFAGDMHVDRPIVPLAPPGVMTHAAYFTLTNAGVASRQLIGVTASSYAMAHIHRTEIKDDIATMSAVEILEIAPGQSISFAQGGLHLMLMRPETLLSEGDSVDLTLEFANGEMLSISATVVPMTGAKPSHGS